MTETSRDMELAPFVLPTVQGSVVQEKSYRTEAFRPAYIKIKTPCDQNRPFRRAMGEQIGARQYSPRQRAMMAAAENLAKQRAIIRNRIEWMCANVLLHDGYAITGEDYPTVLMQFGRPASHRIRQASATRWSQDTSNPVNDLIDWAELFAQNGGGQLDTVIMGSSAFKRFKDHEKVKERWDWASNTGNNANLNLDAQKTRGMKFRNEFDGFQFYTYFDWYITDGVEYERNAAGNLVQRTVTKGTQQPFLPQDSVILLDSMALQGTQAYGAIRDEHFINGMTAMPIATRSWVEKDPGQRFILSQSAPLVFPFRPQSSMHVTTA